MYIRVRPGTGMSTKRQSPGQGRSKKRGPTRRKAPGVEGSRVTATLEGFPLWALRTYQQATKEGEKVALHYIIKRWTQLDPDAIERRITLQRFEELNTTGQPREAEESPASLLHFRKGED